MELLPSSRIFVSSTIQGDMRPYREAAFAALKKTASHGVLLEREWGHLGKKP